MQGHPTAHAQPGPATWVRVLILLTIATILELLTYAFPLGVLTAPILMIFAAIKFVLVVAYYMHLKFDNRILTGIFGWGMLIAISIFAAMAAIYHIYGQPLLIPS